MCVLHDRGIWLSEDTSERITKGDSSGAVFQEWCTTVLVLPYAREKQREHCTIWPMTKTQNKTRIKNKQPDGKKTRP